jgi:hypothetical protein
VAPPRRSRLTGLSGFHVLKISSARCKLATASASWPRISNLAAAVAPSAVV